MPSTHQTGKSSGDYDDEPTRMLATKNDATIKALVRGIRKPERARAYIQAELSLAEAEDRDPRKPLIGMLNSKVTELTADGEDTDETEDDDGS